MDSGNQNKETNENHPNQTKKKPNSSKKKVAIKFLEGKDQNNEPNASHHNSKANFVTDNVKSKPKQAEPKQTEIYSMNESQNKEVAPNKRKGQDKNVGNFKGVTAGEKPHMEKTKPKKKFQGMRNRTAEENRNPFEEPSYETFELDDILNNSMIFDLIQDLVNCFTSNSTLPENELQTLKISLFERTSSVFLNTLNDCVNKTYTRVLNSDFVQELQKRNVIKKDACCQTTLSDTSESEGSQVQQSVIP